MAENPAQGNPNQEETSKLERPRILVQGGMYTNIESDNAYKEQFMTDLRKAAQEGYDVLIDSRKTVVDAVEKVVTLLEENERFNAGHGSYETLEGNVECDAMIMDGKSLKAGSVTSVCNIHHPVLLARTVMEKSDHCTLCANGAIKFAKANGFTSQLVKSRSAIAKYGAAETLDKSDKPAGDTVTAIAMDCKGNFACAASSGGIPLKSNGRIGDVPMIGCGGYANKYGAAAACGHGETIIRMTVAKEVINNMQKQNQSAQDAVDHALQEVKSELEQLGEKPYVSVSAIGKGEKNYGIAAINADKLPWVYICSDTGLIWGTEPGGEVFHE